MSDAAMSDGSFARPLCTARPFADYASRFDLTEADLVAGPILDCPSGGSGLLVELAERGLAGVGVDPVFTAGRASTIERLRADHDFCLAGGFQDYEAADRARMTANLDAFTDLVAAGSPDLRVVAAELPHLPFADASFSLAVSGHLLFTYGDVFTPEFHVAALRELVRVSAGPVRVFPVASQRPSSAHLDPNAPYPHLDDVLAVIRADGCAATLRDPPSPVAQALGWRLLEIV